MTVKDIVSVIKCGRDEMKLAWNGSLKDFDPQNNIDMIAFGRYEVDDVTFTAYKDGDKVKQYIEVAIAMAPVVGKEATA